jgi:hypothetical protein
MALTLSLPPLDPSPAHPPETRPAQVFAWLDATLKRNAIEAARMVGDALAATNAVAIGESRRLELADRYGIPPTPCGQARSALRSRASPLAAMPRRGEASLGSALELLSPTSACSRRKRTSARCSATTGC